MLQDEPRGAKPNTALDTYAMRRRVTMPDMETIARIFERVGQSGVSIRQECCIAVRNRNVTCERCMLACPAEALSLSDGRIEVNSAECLSCGACMVACPTRALGISLRGISDDEVFKSGLDCIASNGRTVTVACANAYERAARHVDPAKIAVVPCLARLDESLIADWAAHGAAKILLVKGDCQECACSDAMSVAKCTVDQARLILAAWGSSCAVTFRDKFPASARRSAQDAYDESRRSFFASLGQDAREIASIAAVEAVEARLGSAEDADAAANGAIVHGAGSAQCGFEATFRDEVTSALKVGRDGTLRHGLPGTRRRLIGALAALMEGDAEAWDGSVERAKDGLISDAVLDTTLWGRVGIDAQRCIGCRMCATFCPTGALGKLGDTDTAGNGGPTSMSASAFGVRHTPAACVQCGSCAAVCPVGAFELRSIVLAAEVAQHKTYAYRMKAPSVAHNRPDTMCKTMRSLLGDIQLYDTQY